MRGQELTIYQWIVHHDHNFKHSISADNTAFVRYNEFVKATVIKMTFAIKTSKEPMLINNSTQKIVLELQIKMEIC